jgi:dTDP-glucose 4,6-dehydratase
LTQAPPLPESDIAFVLETGRALFEDLRGARLFLTGGTGFLGRWLMGTLAAADRAFHLGLRVTVLTRGTEYFREVESSVSGSCVEFHRGDVREFEFPKGNFDFVIHAAAESTRPASDPETRVTIIDGTRRCLELAANRAVRKFLFVSSGSVYGRQPPELARIPEDFAAEFEPEGLNAYGKAKREAEWVVFAANGFDATIARGFAFVGPHLALDRHFAIGNFIRDALAGGPIVVRGDGNPLRSYLYASDLVVWLLTILLNGRPSTAYNVGSEDAISISDLARLVAETVRLGTEVQVLGTPAGDPPARYVPSTERARSELGLRVWTPLAEAIRRTANWYSRRGTAA